MKISNLYNTHTMRVDHSVVFRHILGRSEALLVGGLTAILALGVGGAPANAQSRFTQNAGNVRPNRTAPAAEKGDWEPHNTWLFCVSRDAPFSIPTLTLDP